MLGTTYLLTPNPRTRKTRKNVIETEIEMIAETGDETEIGTIEIGTETGEIGVEIEIAMETGTGIEIVTETATEREGRTGRESRTLRSLSRRCVLALPVNCPRGWWLIHFHLSLLTTQFLSCFVLFSPSCLSLLLRSPLTFIEWFLLLYIRPCLSRRL